MWYFSKSKLRCAFLYNGIFFDSLLCTGHDNILKSQNIMFKYPYLSYIDTCKILKKNYCNNGQDSLINVDNSDLLLFLTLYSIGYFWSWHHFLFLDNIEK